MQAVAERRQTERQATDAMRRELTPEQVGTLYTLERFGWGLKFVRKAGAQKTVILFYPDLRRYAVLKQDGELDENPEALHIRA
jgi:hypothetical protein